MTNRMGGSVLEVDDEAIDQVLAELDEPADAEHPDVSIQVESGWCLSAYQSDRLVWENVEDAGPPRHMRAVSRERMRELFRRVAAGELEAVETSPWLPGYGR